MFGILKKLWKKLFGTPVYIIETDHSANIPVITKTLTAISEKEGITRPIMVCYSSNAKKLNKRVMRLR